MKSKYETLREKIALFNEWEAKRLKTLSMQTRLEQFVILFELGAWQNKTIKSKMHEEHLASISRLIMKKKIEEKALEYSPSDS